MRRKDVQLAVEALLAGVMSAVLLAWLFAGAVQLILTVR
jgi:hypothetical protein